MSLVLMVGARLDTTPDKCMVMYHIYGEDADFLTVKLDCYWTDKTADFNYQSQSQLNRWKVNVFSIKHFTIYLLGVVSGQQCACQKMISIN